MMLFIKLYKKFARIACKLLIVSILSNLFLFSAGAAAGASSDISLSTDSQGLYDIINYDKYIAKHADLSCPDAEIVLPAVNYSNTDMKIEKLDAFEAEGKASIKTQDEGYIEWTVDIREEGLYNIGIKYYPAEGKSSDIEREVRIDGALPFKDARSVFFKRVWTDKSGILMDNRGNDLTPGQIEKPMWMEDVVRDRMGYYDRPYKFYFSKGIHTIGFTSVKEPMVIEYIKLFQEKEASDYAAYSKKCAEAGYVSAKDAFIKIQAENAAFKSDPVLTPVYDRSSPATEPYHPSKIRLNTIGGYKWDQPGQWITWEFDVPEDGLYKIALKERQNFVRGVFIHRRLLLDGAVPFKELEDVKFKYASIWKMDVLGGDEPYLFYLEKGKHRLELESTLGDMSQLLRIAEDSVLELNSAYRKIIMITTTSPDQYRSYHLDRSLPDVINAFIEQSKVLYDLSAKLQALTGHKGSETAILDALAYQLKTMAQKPETIPKRLGAFKENVGALGTWILDIKQQPLELDYIIVASPDKKLPKADSSVMEKIMHEVRAFVASFTEDYNSIGNVYSNKKSITVWMGVGHDQAQILKDLIDSSFTPQSGIQVNLKLVQGALLPATVAGLGPDVALQNGGGDPVNFATRGAVLDLTQFSDFPEVEKRFSESAVVPFRYRNGVYALPEMQSFSMLFYRKDVLEELKLSVPETWDDVYRMLPVLQKHNFEFGFPISDIDSPGAGMTTYGMFLYQNGGKFYKGDGKASDLDSEVAISSFKNWTKLYTSYKLPQKFNFSNRFRTGEMPIGISDYTLYNTLVVFAPEIRGLWGFAPVPGIKAGGEIRRDVPGSASSCFIIKYTKDKKASWEFLKWWTSKEVQVRYGREMESLVGAAARQPTANIEAMSELPWPTKDYKCLMEEWKWVEGIPEVPGGYFTSRHLDNAFRKVINEGTDERETLLDYIRVINKEITIKRQEFGLK